MPMKTGILTDPHYSSAPVTCGRRYNSRSLEKLRVCFNHFRDNGCETVILLGDITDTEPTHEMELENLRRVAALMDEYPFRIICLMGNHDAFTLTPEEFYGIIGDHRRPRTTAVGCANLLFLDACYFADGRHYAPGDSNWEDTFYPHEEALQKELAKLTEDVHVFMHQNIDPLIPENHRLSNAANIRSILEDSGKVRSVWQGHYHPGHKNTHNGIQYTALPALCENEPLYPIIIHNF